MEPTAATNGKPSASATMNANMSRVPAAPARSGRLLLNFKTIG
jgi:hypothetical protein